MPSSQSPLPAHSLRLSAVTKVACHGNYSVRGSRQACASINPLPEQLRRTASPLSLSHCLLSWPHLGDSKAIRGKQGASQEDSFTMVYSPVSGCTGAGGRTTPEAHRYGQAVSVARTPHRESVGPSRSLSCSMISSRSWRVPARPPSQGRCEDDLRQQIS